VNTHLRGLTKSDPWNTNIPEVAAQLNYIGVRLIRDWIVHPEDGDLFNSLQVAWRPDGRFWTSIAEDSPAGQRSGVAATLQVAKTYPKLLYAVGGPNEEDDTYPQKLGATLPDSALVQADLYNGLHPLGILVSQMEFGAGWTAANNWTGNYDPNNTGSHQNFTPGPADFGGAHTYLSDTKQTMAGVIKRLRADAQLTTPGKPVAHTEIGAYNRIHITPMAFGQQLVIGALDSFAGGDVGFLVYGLQDSKPEATYGFYTFPEGAKRPVAEYFHTMTTVLKSASGSYGPGAKATFQIAPLNVTFDNAATSHLVMQKPTGEYVIADWSEQLMNENAQEETDTVHFGKKFASATVYDVEDGLTPIATLSNASEVRLTMKPCDTYLVVLK
jgi:hypothetical protein